MTASIEARGAPIDQGVAQGSALRSDVSSHLRALRGRYGPLAWQGALLRAHAAPGRTIQRFLPQLHERLRGIALGGRVRTAALELAESVERVRGAGSAAGAALAAWLEVPAQLRPHLIVRRSAPDAVGFASVELTCAHWCGCLAGVNEQGVAVVALDDRGPAATPARVLAQDLLLRAQTLASGVDHLRLRVRYAGGSGALLAVDPAGEALRLELDRGGLRVTPAGVEAPLTEPGVRVDAKDRALVWVDPRGDSQRAVPPDSASDTR